MEDDVSEKRSDFWMKVAGVSFALWSLAIPIGVLFIKDSVNSVVIQQRDFNERFNNYIFSMERRVTLLEERQTLVIKKLADIDEDVHFGKPKNGK